MNTTSLHSIRAQDLTDEAFAPYGDIIKPRLSGEQFDRTHSYDPSKEETHVKLVMTNGTPTLRIMQQRLRGLTFFQNRAPPQGQSMPRLTARQRVVYGSCSPNKWRYTPAA